MTKFLAKKSLIILTMCISLLLFPAGVFAQEDRDPCAECPYPLVGQNIYIQGGVGYFMLAETIISVFDKFMEACLVFDRYNIQKVVIILNSPGGSLFEGIAFSQKMIEEKNKGRIIEIRAYGEVASAASIIMAVGSRGHRYIAPHTILMIHELQTLEWGIKFEGVSAKEKEAEVSRYLQNNMEKFVLPHIKLTKEELAEKCKEESWTDAKTAIKWGFADKLIQ